MVRTTVLIKEHSTSKWILQWHNVIQGKTKSEESEKLDLLLAIISNWIEILKKKSYCQSFIDVLTWEYRKGKLSNMK